VRPNDHFMKSWMRQDYHFHIMIETRCSIYDTYDIKWSTYEI